jgi:hypothetical protein
MHVTRIMESLVGEETPTRVSYDLLHQQMRLAENQREHLADQRGEIAPWVASHVLWHLGHGGYSPTR